MVCCFASAFRVSNRNRFSVECCDNQRERILDILRAFCKVHCVLLCRAKKVPTDGNYPVNDLLCRCSDDTRLHVQGYTESTIIAMQQREAVVAGMLVLLLARDLGSI